jgi:dCMP deaminase
MTEKIELLIDEAVAAGHIIRLQEQPLGTRPNWDEAHMHMAIGVAPRASCHNVRAGAVITDVNNQVLATGYNGAPGPIKRNCLETGCRKSNEGLDYHKSLNSGYCVGVHAEKNAAGHLNKKETSGITVYNTVFPCHTCAKDLLPYGLSRFVFKRGYSPKEFPQTLALFEEAGVEISQLDLSPQRDMDIRYNHPDVLFDVWSAAERAAVLDILGIEE